MRFLIGLLLLALPQIAAGQGDEQIAISPARARALVDSAATEYYRAKFALYPAYATSRGVRTWDAELSTFAPAKVRKFLILAKSRLRDLRGFTEDSLSIQEWVDMKALVSDMETQTFLLEEVAIQARSPLLYVDACTNALYQLVIRDPDFRQNPDFIARLSAVPQVMESARKNVIKPIRLHGELASASITAYLPFVEGLEDPAAGSAALASAARDARAALASYRAHLDSTNATADTVFALGYDNFAKLLEVEHLVEQSPQELLAYAERTLRECQARRDSLPAPAKAAPPDTAAALKLTKADILAGFTAETDSAIAFLRRRDIVDIPPDTEVVPVDTPEFIRVLVPGYAYEQPGPFDKDQRGLLYVPLPKVLDLESQLAYRSRLDQRQYRGIVVHELYPGHHLQLTSANRAPTYIRKMAEDLFAIEGWALYCDQLMNEQGYYGPDGERRVLGGVIFRAARAVVDVKLQTGEFSLQEATDFMVAQTKGDRAFLEQEVRRYAVEPTQPMSYLIGRREMLSLREESKRLEGSRFSLKGFHDAVLSCGSLPPFLIRVSVISDLTGRR